MVVCGLPWALLDLNQRPTPCRGVALPTELKARGQMQLGHRARGTRGQEDALALVGFVTLTDHMQDLSGGKRAAKLLLTDTDSLVDDFRIDLLRSYGYEYGMHKLVGWALLASTQPVPNRSGLDTVASERD